MILIHPPLSKPCEPPAGIARLAGVVEGKGNLAIIDANLDGILSALHRPLEFNDTWTRRAKKNIQTNLDYLRTKNHRWDIDRYTRSVKELNRLLGKFPPRDNIRMSLNNYQDEILSPVKNSDLIRAAEEPEKNPFYSRFRDWLIRCTDD